MSDTLRRVQIGGTEKEGLLRPRHAAQKC